MAESVVTRELPQSTRPVGITLGDAAGIGPEIIVKLFQQGLPWPAVVYGDAGALWRALNQLGLESQFSIEPLESVEHYTSGHIPGRIPVINRWQPLPNDLPLGQIHASAGRAAYEYVCHATDDALAGHLRAVVTAPLHKEALQAAGITQPGHTEILAERSGAPYVAMMLANQELRVILVTIHIPLAHVSTSLSVETELTTIRLAHQACRKAGISSPRIAVAGLNPHAGEHGKFGREELDIIEPAIHQAQQEGIHVTGPWPGDTIFMRARRGEFDIVVAQYHDQGLIPVKYLGVDEGVNITVGLPFVRTSVDHGTAFDIAGHNKADPGSLRAAFAMALNLSSATQP